MKPHSLSHFAPLLMLLMLLTACSGTRLAYDTAETLDAKAYVVSEHYAALVREAADLRDAGALEGANLARAQAADDIARGAVLELRTLSERYTAVRSAENEQELQSALNEAVLAVARFARIIRGRE